MAAVASTRTRDQSVVITPPTHAICGLTMLRLLSKILHTGVVTEPAFPPSDEKVTELGIEVKRVLDRNFSGSLAIRQVDAGSCNGCELEIHALNNPYYDIERFGVHFVASPRHADCLLVTGPVSRHMEYALQRVYEACPDPKLVIAAGTCACDGGEFGVSTEITGGNTGGTAAYGK